MAGKKKIEIIGKVSNASVLKGSGKDWQSWVDRLDKAGAGAWTHQETVAYLKKKYKLGWWWEQGVTYGYQIHKGLRIEGQSLKGEYSVTATKMFSLGDKKLWKAWTSSEGLSVWLNPMSEFEFIPKAQFEIEGGIFGEIRTMKSPERARLTWQDEDWPKPTIVNIQLFARTKEKCGLAIVHGGLKSVAQREEMRARWKTSLIKFGKFIQKEKS